MQTLIYWAWGGAWESAFLTGSQVPLGWRGGRGGDGGRVQAGVYSPSTQHSALPFSTLLVVTWPSLRACVLCLVCRRSGRPTCEQTFVQTASSVSGLRLVGSAEPALADSVWG